MQVIYYKDSLPKVINKSIFLAGGSLRPNQDGVSWRKEALSILEDIGFDGVVFCPENQDGKFDEDHNYSETVEWEELGLNVADCILFWMPRDLKNLPCFTSNHEFGAWQNSGKVVLGYPDTAEKMKYQQYYADKLNIPSFNTLEETIRAAVDFVADGDDRTGGERNVPLYIWNTPQFKSWYNAQVLAGNRLDGARALYNFRPGNKSFVFMNVLHVDMYIKSEDRNKNNEFVVSRTDISSVLMYLPNSNIKETQVVLVREYRSPASTKNGFILELPGGSSTNTSDDALDTAAEEVFEETGMHIDSSRLKYQGARQLAGTLSSHKLHLYSIEITEEELVWFKSQDGIVRGKEEDSERTYVEVHAVNDLLENELTDWTTLGTILSVLTG